MKPIIKQYWDQFLQDTGRDEHTPLFDEFCFSDNEQSANELLELVLAGKKTATASSQLYYEITTEFPPTVGNLSIVTNWDGEPQCVIETTAVTVLPFDQITYEICKREGEDENLESWRQNHRAFFTRDGADMGYEFTEQMPVIFEDFQVIYR